MNESVYPFYTTTKLCFKLQDADDLPFRKGEVLYVVNKDEEQWWTARNSQGQIGQIPVPYIQKVHTHKTDTFFR